MAIEQWIPILGWMGVINTILFMIGLAKVTIFSNLTNKVMIFLFKEKAGEFERAAYTVIFMYWILIIMFNFVPYITLRILI